MRYEGDQCCPQAHKVSGLSMDLSFCCRACWLPFVCLTLEFRTSIEMLYSKDIMKTEPWERITVDLWCEKPIKTLFFN